MNFGSRMRSLVGQLRHVPRAIGLVWAAAPGWTVAWFALLTVQGLLPVAMVYLIQSLIDGLGQVMSGGKGLAESGVMSSGAWLTAVLIAGDAAGGLAGWVRAVQSELVGDDICGRIHRHAFSLDMARFDDPSFYDMLHRARVEALSRPASLLQHVGGMGQSALTLAAMATVLSRFGAWVPAVLLLGTMPALVVTFESAWRMHAWRRASTQRVRRARYLDWMMTDRSAAPELKLFELGGTLEADFQSLRKDLREESALLARREAMAATASGALGTIVMAGSMAAVFHGASAGGVTLGSLAGFAQAFLQGQRMMRSMLGSSSELVRNAGFLENLFEFLDMKPSIELTGAVDGPPVLLNRELRLEEVSFRYPAAPKLSLERFNLTVPAGTIAAIVGENGAGKSTLLKLLLRFYDPESGRVSIDGRDLREISPAALRRTIAVLFQEPVRYSETAARNIAYGDLASSPGMDRIEAAARAAGADQPVSRLSSGYDTVLGKWLGGAELSVGEWQRLALARAFLRDASLIVLDEPTSAMDSWAEADWLARFRKLADGRTALIITHRFTTALQADSIHVMQRGRVVESGSHSQLVALGGLYAQSWRDQTRQAGAMDTRPPRLPASESPR